MASTKDPHIAMIDAHEKMENIKLRLAAAQEALTSKIMKGYRLTAEDRQKIASFRQQIIDETRRVQDDLAEELQSHGKLDS
jgi:hypothetical protein